MKVEIKKLYSLEIEDEISSYWPAETYNFGTWIRLSVGPTDELGADYFDLFVCTPQWLSEELEKDPVAQWGRHSLIVKGYNLAAIADQLDRMVQRCSGDDWQEIAVKIARFAAWEFEDYKM
ncbi:immunity 8 family protein [Paraburkholderia sp. IW21]|uniref:immunity 8 family protein n=1 Tax=Paraburkholderia sp. IW21 TaxID=3242488 RepID=UPI0035200142